MSIMYTLMINHTLIIWINLQIYIVHSFVSSAAFAFVDPKKK